MSALGNTQRSVMRSLQDHGGRWSPGCGWYWDTASGTDRIMRSLVKRGLLRQLATASGMYGSYELTEEGKAWRP